MDPIIQHFPEYKDAFAIYSALADEPHSFFLDSALPHPEYGRYSFIGTDPFLILTAKGRTIQADMDGWRKTFTGNPFHVLNEFLSRYKIDFSDNNIPFWGGAVGWLGYDLKCHVEKYSDTAAKEMDVPDMFFCFYDCALIFDELKKESFIASTGLPEFGAKRPMRARARMEALKNKIALSAQKTAKIDQSPAANNRVVSSNFTKDEYVKMILKAKEHIKCGDIYQVNLAQRFCTRTEEHPFEIYRRLREINPAPFSAYLNFGDTQVISASPERFLKISGREIETCPIKGTRPRGTDEARDRALRDELTGSSKDRAENLMIVDLERNDLGRICDYGSVRVTELMKCEDLPSVFHLVSTVKGTLKAGLDPVTAIMNCFPGGSITGAPKIRAAEIIEELEKIKREVYTGSICRLGFNGDMDSSIVIRTIIHKNGRLSFSAGGGITDYSDPELEYEETLHKAGALFKAVGSDLSLFTGCQSENIFKR